MAVATLERPVVKDAEASPDEIMLQRMMLPSLETTLDPKSLTADARAMLLALFSDELKACLPALEGLPESRAANGSVFARTVGRGG